ncbi:MAG: hypothetical protein VW337_06995 [Gammaproteobacteria bacterium]
MGNKDKRGDRKAKKVTKNQSPMGPTREEADYYYQKHSNMVPVVIDRRPNEKNRNSW